MSQIRSAPPAAKRTTAAGSRLQIFMAAPGSAAMQQLLWSFVPTVLVPFSLISHGSFGSSFVAHVT
jgi:hypothetical protein